jgi:superfamily I DNA and RNA helicase
MLDNELELAYAITVHKFQGSEAPIVVIPIHKCLSQFVTQRNWAYTAASRAQKVCVLVGQLEEVKKIIGRNRQQKRWTRLEKMLIDKSIKPLAPVIADNRARCPKCKMIKHLVHYSPFHKKNICAHCFTETET